MVDLTEMKKCQSILASVWPGYLSNPQKMELKKGTVLGSKQNHYIYLLEDARDDGLIRTDCLTYNPLTKKIERCRVGLKTWDVWHLGNKKAKKVKEKLAIYQL
jgi:hypothetical protein